MFVWVHAYPLTGDHNYKYLEIGGPQVQRPSNEQ